MTKSVRKFTKLVFTVVGAAALLSQGCSLIDDNLADCPVDYTLNYDMRLITNINTELATQLSLSSDVVVSTALKRHLMNDIFTDFAHDAVLNFYEAETDRLSDSSIDTVINANSTSLQLKIKADNYRHIAVANIKENGVVRLDGETRSATVRLAQQVADTVPPHRTGLFADHMDMVVTGDEDQTFSDTLRMVNCAVALVVDTLGSHLKKLKVVASGFATGYRPYTGEYEYDYTPVHRTDELELDSGTQRCFVTVAFPSRDPALTKTTIETEDPFVSTRAEESIWNIRFYGTKPDGTVVETTFGVHQPIRGGQLRIVKAKAYDNGSVQPVDTSPTTGVSVSVEWNYIDMGEIPL